MEAIGTGKTPAEVVSAGAERCQAGPGEKLARNHCLLAKFPRERRADERFLHAFMLAAKK